MNELFEIITDFYKRMNEITCFLDIYLKLKDSRNDDPYKDFKKEIMSHQSFYDASIIVTAYGNFEGCIKELGIQYLNMLGEKIKKDTDLYKELSWYNMKNIYMYIARATTYSSKITSIDMAKNNLQLTLDTENILKIDGSINSINFMNASPKNILEYAKNILRISNFENELKSSKHIIEYARIKFPSLAENELKKRINNDASIFSDLVDFVNARHEVAHTGVITSGFGVQNLKEKYLPLLTEFVMAYYEVLMFNLLINLLKYSKDILCEIKFSLNVSGNSKIICSDLQCSKILKNDFMLIKRKDNYFVNQIEELMVEDKNVNIAVKNDKTGIKFKRAINKEDLIFYFS
ncbi:MAG: MAE_28990/MAE_18760 family HEPN-like nuclease [Bacilli bacterium]|nr:MAE_28990/MAE_18760 family HEPN-like nuclease [Bacilli bacterium]